ncbi:MAG: exonuclease domain-containing protein [Candidatus Paceibacterota bacterium]
MEFLFLDTETTGNDVTKDRLCQVCYKLEGRTQTAYFKPPLPISVKSMSITHITNKMVADKESFAESKFRQNLEKLLAEHILVAHNAKFDIAILEAEGLTVPRSICTLRLARHLDEQAVIPEYNLQFLRYYLDLEVPGQAHDAEADVLVAEAIFRRQYEKIKAGGLSDEETAKRMMEISARPTLFKKFTFGKHLGRTLAEVATTDRDYLEWLLKQKLASGEEDEDWIYTLRHYLG